MLAPPFSPPTSSSSSSQSLNHLGPDSWNNYSMSQHTFNINNGQGSVLEPDPDGMGESVTEDDDERDGSRDSRDSSRDTRDGNGVDKRKPRITLPRGGACVACRYVIIPSNSSDADLQESEIVSTIECFKLRPTS